MKYEIWLSIVIVSTLISIVLALILCNVLRMYRNSKRGLDKVNTLSKCMPGISNRGLHNSIVCNLKRKLEKQLKDVCNTSGVESIEVESAQYGVVMLKVGFDYVQNRISDLIDRVLSNDDIYKKILLLQNIISQSKESIFVSNEYKHTLVKCELQNMPYIRVLLGNVFNLIKDMEVDQVDFMKVYHVKLDYGLAFITKGLSFVMKDIRVLDGFYSDAELYGDGFFYDEDYITFSAISLSDVESYTYENVDFVC
ncbi:MULTISPECIES: hypothetical protein [Ehrlichia]|uniref:Uncharacterized protein n=1 Tax=Ehrlichia cf. muris str. EmCRT TaxID=1359167 RepID=A0A0F3ND35_9RICK|nr:MULTISPECIES: hypothetical protein [Ehrlichia]KJV65597.1 hypothetical protein EMUCRT_0542 [Ehrlichia cf. muris str. EmCRT]OUC04466.1 hypothetical protein DB91_02770 [Ehrlichia sp. Wisconsin_h]